MATLGRPEAAATSGPCLREGGCGSSQRNSPCDASCARPDAGPFGSFVVPGATGTNPYNQSVFGVAHEGIGALRDNDEVFLQLKYQF